MKEPTPETVHVNPTVENRGEMPDAAELLGFNTAVEGELPAAKKVRQSNFELLRLVAMLFVLLMHANYGAFGHVTADTIAQSPFTSLLRVFLQAMSRCAVDLFVMISGWFAIRASLRGLLNFLFQCAWFYVGLWLVTLVLSLNGHSVPSFSRMMEINWFVSRYVGLFLLSPILNIFCERCSRRQLTLWVVAFYIYQTLFDWTGISEFTIDGFSVISFVGLYLLARCLRRWDDEGRLSPSLGWLFPGCVLLITAGMMLNPGWPLFSYVSPLVIGSGVGLLVIFRNIRMRPSRVVNYLAASCFAVLLFQTNAWMWGYYGMGMRRIYAHHPALTATLGALAWILAWYVAAILLDQPRRWLFRLATRRYAKVKG